MVDSEAFELSQKQLCQITCDSDKDYTLAKLERAKKKPAKTLTGYND